MVRTLCILSALVFCALPARAGDEPAVGTAHFISATPAFPEGVAVRKRKAYVSTSAIFGTAGNNTPSAVSVYDLKTDQLVRTLTITGEDLSQEHALSGMAFDGDGTLYVISTQLGIVRLDPDGDAPQRIYAQPLPHLQPCPAPAPCKPVPFDGPPLPNDIVFDARGNLYVTDSLQATIWRIPPGGGQPQLWFQDGRLGGSFGPNGIRLDRERKNVYFNVTADFTGRGTVYTLPLVDHPSAQSLTPFHVYLSEGPDDMAFGRSGKLYVSLASSNQISVLAPDGTELTRFSGPTDSGVPFDGPANIAFDDKSRSIVFSNHASTSRIAAHFAVISVFVDDQGDPLEQPELE